MEKYFVLCSWCKEKIKAPNSEAWGELEDPAIQRLYQIYLNKNYDISHAICPECEEKYKGKVK